MKDIRGVEIEEGSEVLYFKTGRYSEIFKGVIVQIKTKVKIDHLVSLNRPSSSEERHPKWVDHYSLVAVSDLPEVVEK